jgi:hypothetical protein
VSPAPQDRPDDRARRWVERRATRRLPVKRSRLCAPDRAGAPTPSEPDRWSSGLATPAAQRPIAPRGSVPADELDRFDAAIVGGIGVVADYRHGEHAQPARRDAHCPSVGPCDSEHGTSAVTQKQAAAADSQS